MNIKTLQNDFTTPEQPKRLLELGVPADSADCIRTLYRRNGDDKQIEVLIESYSSTKRTDIGGNEMEQYPCWSVGRIMKIYLTCKTNNAIGFLHFTSADDWDEDIIDCICDLFSAAVRCGYMDFSKLED